MKHKVGYNRLGRKSAHRKSMTRNMVTSLFKYERITTSKAKAREIRRTAEKMITRAKVDSVHNRRTVGKDIKDQEILAKLFTDIGPRFVSRPGGYTRMLKLGPRPTDATEMVILELVSDDEEGSKGKSGKKASVKSSTTKSDGAGKNEAGQKPSTSRKQSKAKAPSEEQANTEEVSTEEVTHEADSDSDDGAPQSAGGKSSGADSDASGSAEAESET